VFENGDKSLRAILSILAVGVVACAGSAGGATWRGSERSLDRSSGVATEAATPPTVETDAQRRERLNARLSEMIRAGQGGRLSDSLRARDAGRARTVVRAVTRSQSPEPVLPVGKSATPDVGVETVVARPETSTIAPPATRAPARPAGRGYVPPRLDLISQPVIPTSDIECLTQAIYYEARNESEDGQAAVAEVVLNRSRAGNYPRDVCQVVYQRNSRTCQFTFTCDGSIGRGPINAVAWARAERIAREVHAGRAQTLLPRSSVNYHANYVRPSWGRRLEKVRQIGAHIFYGRALNGTTPGAAEVPVGRPTAGGLQFVRIEALDRAYASLTSSPQPAVAP